MQCPDCGTANPDEYRFCHRCGTVLAAVCPGCGLVCPPEANFCGRCGRSLAQPARPASAPDGGARRQITTLFADLSGYTTLTRELGDEATHHLTSRFFEHVDGIIERFGGHVDKHIGDCVMAVFGAPVARGNDAERALRAALEIRSRVATVGADFGREIAVHIGVASGQVVAGGPGHREFAVTGDSVNLASRLTDAAASGEILVGDSVRVAVPDLFDYADAGTLAVKGYTEPVRVWRLIGEQRQHGQARRPLIGRRSELHQFRAALKACVDYGAGHAIYLRGEAGIGKSHLVEEFAREAVEAGFQAHLALVLDFGAGTGHDAIRALARSLIRLPLLAGQEEGASAVDRAEREGLISADERVFLNALLDLPQPVELRARYDAMDNAMRELGTRETLKRLVAGASARQPLVLLIEDIHWADRMVLERLAGLVEAIAACPVVLIMTSRIEGDPLDAAWRARTGGSPLTTIDLGPLSPADARALASGFIDATTSYAERCIERAAGNPLFLEHLLRHAQESGDAAVPASVQSLVQARLDLLEPLDREALSAAAVLGQRFTLEALRHLIERPDYVCAGLTAHFLVRPQAEGFLFAHALIRDGTYGTLLHSRRRALHERAAAWFAGRDPVLHAEHLDRAENPRAPRAYFEAAMVQAREYRYEAALELTRRGVELARMPADVAALACLEGEILHDLGSIAASLAAYERALEAASGDRDRCRAWLGIAADMRMVDRYEDALAALDHAEPLARAGHLLAELARAHYLRGNLYFPLGNIDGVLREHEQALTSAREADSVELKAQALCGLGDAEYARGRMLTARSRFLECIALCREHGFGRIEVASLPMAAINLMYAGDARGALEEARAAVDAAARVGHARAQAIAHHAAYFAGFYSIADTSEVHMHLARSLELARALGSKRFEAESLTLESDLARFQGRRPEALELAREALAIARASDMNYMGPVILSSFALATDDRAERRSALCEAEALLASARLSHNVFFFRRDAIEAALEDGAWSEARRHAAALEAYTRAEPLPWSSFYTARGRALSAYGRGARIQALWRQLTYLREEARRIGLLLWLPSIEKALADW